MEMASEAKNPYEVTEEFDRQLRFMKALHDKKQEDYGGVGDPFVNLRSSEEFGIRPWLGTLVRMNDKISRLKTYARTGRLANEGVEDTFRDLAVYAIIGLILWQEDETKWSPPAMMQQESSD